MAEMMSVEEIEAACNASRPLDFARHPLEGPELKHHAKASPYGFPARLRSNSAKALSLYQEAWKAFPRKFDTPEIHVDVTVVPGDGVECPPTPNFRILLPLMISMADADNYSVIDLERNTTTVVISEAAMRHPLYATYFFLEHAASCHITNRYVTPVHAGCVEWAGSGVLLCGDSGAGKSTLSYACARAGFGYISDDASFLLRGLGGRIALGNPYKVRLRPEAARFFPEMRDLPITPRAAGKPSIEVAASAGIRSCAETRVNHIVFLNRRSGREQLSSYRADIARSFFRQTAWGVPAQQQERDRDVEGLLTAQLHELHYSDLDWAVHRLRKLAEESL
ncbi:HPr kinase/phosphorylase [Terriglobus sp. TAA 43]|uniref:HPr kinase/phosphorylase n=1 Tax=Terriglobus sp. TAA 43 TaxID=278961 RepID=UPI001E5466A4|nr:aldolase [Terriglobus sp. TAA 43]